MGVLKRVYSVDMLPCFTILLLADLLRSMAKPQKKNFNIKLQLHCISLWS
uniref:Uncharacterized protein n=1 Tax=Rhizophora mucronata TaxID=61149 RepID=A0A2P2NB23_RHIMU